MITCLLHGFYRQGLSPHVWLLVDSDSSPFEKAGEITGDSICFATGLAGLALGVVIPDDCKGVLFREEELYARLPQLRRWGGA